MVLSWPTPPPLRISDSAPSTSSTSVLRPERSSPMVSPSPRVSELGFGRRRERHELLAEQAGLPDLGDRVAGQLDVAVEEQGDLGGVPVELDVLDAAHRDVVDLDRGLRHQVEHVAELDGDLVGVVADVGAAGQRQAVDGEVAAGEQQAARRGERREPGRGPARGASSRTSHDARQRGVDVLDLDHATAPGAVVALAGAGTLQQSGELTGRGALPGPRAPGRQDLRELVAQVSVGVGRGDQGAQRRRGVGLQRGEVLAEVRAGVQRAGARVVGVEQVRQRDRRDRSASRRGRRAA